MSRRNYSKFGNKRTVVDGYTFDSEREAVRYSELKVLQQAGEIGELSLQVKFVLAPGVHIVGQKRKSPDMRYYADFCYNERDGTAIVEDCKGFLTPVYKIKRHLMKTVHGIDIKET